MELHIPMFLICQKEILKNFETQGTVEYIYDGVNIKNNKNFIEKNHKCIFRDNFFETFYTKISEGTAGIYQKNLQVL